MTLEAVAAVLFAGATVVAIGFQIGLALGAPWGRFAMGGRYPGSFPPPMRAGAVVQALVLGALALVVLADAGLVLDGPLAGLRWLVWLPVAFSALSSVLNTVTRSRAERRLWLPVALTMLATSLVVALTGP